MEKSKTSKFKQLLWFIGLWLAGVGTVMLVATLIRTLIHLGL